MAEVVRRIDFDDKGGLDDVAISHVDMFRLEYMDDNTVWICLIRKGRRDEVFWLKSRGKITGTHYQD